MNASATLAEPLDRGVMFPGDLAVAAMRPQDDRPDHRLRADPDMSGAGSEGNDELPVAGPVDTTCRDCGAPADVLRGRWSRTCPPCRKARVDAARAAGTLTGKKPDDWSERQRARAGRRPSPEPEASAPEAPETPEAEETPDPYPRGWLSEERVRGTAEKIRRLEEEDARAAASAAPGPAPTVEASSVEEPHVDDATRELRKRSVGPPLPTLAGSVADAVERLPVQSARVERAVQELREARDKVSVAERALEREAQVFVGILDGCRNGLLLALRQARGPADTSD